MSMRNIAHTAESSENFLSYGATLRTHAAIQHTFTGTFSIGDIVTYFERTTLVCKAFALATVFVSVVNVSSIVIALLFKGFIIFRLQSIASCTDSGILCP